MAIDPKTKSIFSRLDPEANNVTTDTEKVDSNYLWSLAKKYANWQEVPDEDRKHFTSFAILEGFKTASDAFEYLKAKITPLDDKTEELRRIEAANSNLNSDLIAGLVQEYQENQSRLKASVSANCPGATEKQIEQILTIYRLRQAQLIRSKILTPENQAVVGSAVKASNPKQSEPASDFENAAEYITTTAIKAIEKTGVTFSNEQKDLAAENLVLLSLLETSISKSSPEEKANHDIEIALASANREYALKSESPLAKLVNEVNAGIKEVSNEEMLGLALPLQLSSRSTLASLALTPALETAIASGQITESWLDDNLPKTSEGDSLRAALAPYITPPSSDQNFIDTSVVPKHIYIQPKAGQTPTFVQEGDTLTISGDVTTQWIIKNVPLTGNGAEIRQAIAETASLPDLPASSTTLRASLPAPEPETAAAPSPSASPPPPIDWPETITKEWVEANFPESDDPETTILREALLKAVAAAEKQEGSKPSPTTPAPIINAETNTVFTPPTDIPSEERLDASTTRFAELLASSDPDLLDRTLILAGALGKVKDNIASDPKVAKIVADSKSNITTKFAGDLLTAVRHDLPDLNPRAFSSQTAATASAIAKGLNDVASASSIDLFSQLTAYQISQAIDHAIANPDSDLGKMYAKDPGKFVALLEKYDELSNSELGAEIIKDSKPRPRKALTPPETGGRFGLNHLTYSLKSKLSAFGTKASSFIDNKVSRLPVVGKYSQYIFHPVQAFKHWVGDRIGQAFARQIVDQVGRRVIAKIGNEFTKKAVETLIKSGLKEVLKKGATTLATKVTTGLAADAALAATGVGAPVAAILLVIQVAVALFQILKAPIDKASEFVWGEKIKKKDLLLAPVLIGSAVATSVAGVLLISGAFVAIMYLAAFNIAPIIGSLAITGEFHAPGTSTTTPGRPPVIPPGTDLTANCPSGVPTQPAYPIMQGPRVGSHTISYSYAVGGKSYPSEGEALDFGTPAGTGIFSTHNGTAYFFAEGTAGMSGLGNFVVVTGVCNDNPFLTLYGHMQPLPYGAGTSMAIGKGSYLGNSGNSGTLGDGYHLHYEIFGLGDIYRYL